MSSVNNSGLNPAVVAAGFWLDKAGESGKAYSFVDADGGLKALNYKLQSLTVRARTSKSRLAQKLDRRGDIQFIVSNGRAADRASANRLAIAPQISEYERLNFHPIAFV